MPLLFVLASPCANAGVIQEMDGIFKSAQIHFNLGDLSKALDMFTELRRRDATFRGREVQLYIANCYEAMANLEKAYQEYKRFLERFPNAPSAPKALVKLIAIGKALGKKEDNNQLSQSLWKMIQSAKAEEKAPLLFDLSLLERNAGEEESAVLFESEVREKYPLSVGAFWLQR